MTLAALLVTAIAVLSAAAGVALASFHAFARKLIPFGGGVLVGVAIFWVLPEMADFLRWPAAFAWIAAGVGLIYAIDHFVYPVCAACSHEHGAHNHDHCSTRLHGFAPPLLLAIAIHSALDGWSVAASRGTALTPTFSAAIAIHKIPEGLALGVIGRAALDSRATAFFLCTLAEAMTLVGALLEGVLAPYLGGDVLHALLAMAGGSFLYLGAHAVHGEWRRGGRSVFVPALTGIAGPSVLRLLRIL